MTPAEEAEIFRTHKPFVHKHARKSLGVEYDDAVQNASLSFLLALRQWTPEGGANVRTFASNYLWWRRAYLKKLQSRQVRTVSIETPIDEDGTSLRDVLGSPATQEDEAIRAQELRSAKAEIAKLPPRTQKLLRLRFEKGWTLARIGKQLGLSRERIRQIEAAALDTVRERISA